MTNTTPIISNGNVNGINYARLASYSRMILTDSTVTANGSSALYYVGGARQIDLLIDVTGTVSGTSPTLQFSITSELVDDTNFSTTLLVNDVGTVQTYKGTSLTATGADNITVVGSASGSGSTNTSVIGDYITVAWAVGGTSPSFGGVYARLVAKK